MTQPVLRVTQRWGREKRPVCPYCGTREIFIFETASGDFCAECFRKLMDGETAQVADGQGDLFGGGDGAATS